MQAPRRADSAQPSRGATEPIEPSRGAPARGEGGGSAGYGLIGGLIASIPIIGPALTSFCAACVGAAAAAGGAAGVTVAGPIRYLAAAAGLTILAGASWWRLRTVRSCCTPEEYGKRRLRVLSAAVISGVIAYVFATFVITPFLVGAASQLSRGFSHQLP